MPRGRLSHRMVARGGKSSRRVHFQPHTDAGRMWPTSLQVSLSAVIPWHQFVFCGCHAGNTVPTYVRIGLPRLVAWLRGLVGPNAAGILTMARRSCRPARLNFRNRKSARGACRCMALIAVITAVNASNSELSDSTRRSRTITDARWLVGASKSWSFSL